jgi:prophage maintenance system killer protein
LPSGKRHYRLTLADALSAHARALRTGGRDGIPNIELVASAIERPYNGYYREIARKASALVQSMSGNHGFADGNKRTTIILTHLLLSRAVIDCSRFKLMERSTLRWRNWFWR